MAPTTRAVRLGAGDRTTPIAGAVPDNTLASIEMTRPTANRAAACPARGSADPGDRGCCQKRDRAVLAHGPNGTDDGGQADDRLGGKADRHGRARWWTETHPPRRHERCGGECPGPQKAIRQLLTAPRPRARRRSSVRRRKPRRTGPWRTRAAQLPTRPAPPAIRRKVQPGARAEHDLGDDDEGESFGDGADDAADRRCRESGEHQGAGPKRPSTAPPTRLAAAIDRASSPKATPDSLVTPNSAATSGITGESACSPTVTPR